MNLVEKFKQHIEECPLCDSSDPTKLCPVGQALLAQLVKENGVLEKIQKEKP